MIRQSVSKVKDDERERIARNQWIEAAVTNRRLGNAMLRSREWRPCTFSTWDADSLGARRKPWFKMGVFFIAS
jgi:hypothetical protein